MRGTWVLIGDGRYAIAGIELLVDFCFVFCIYQVINKGGFGTFKVELLGLDRALVFGVGGQFA